MTPSHYGHVAGWQISGLDILSAAAARRASIVVCRRPVSCQLRGAHLGSVVGREQATDRFLLATQCDILGGSVCTGEPASNDRWVVKTGDLT